MDEISSRHIPTYFEAEGTISNRDAVFALLSDPLRGSLKDKTRLAACYILNAPTGLADADELKRMVSDAASVITDATGVSAGGAGGEHKTVHVIGGSSAADIAEAMAALDYAVTTRRTTAALTGEATSGPSSAAGPATGTGSKLLGMVSWKN